MYEPIQKHIRFNFEESFAGIQVLIPGAGRETPRERHQAYVLGMPRTWHIGSGVALLGQISLTAPRKLPICIIKKYNHRIKVSKDKLI